MLVASFPVQHTTLGLHYSITTKVAKTFFDSLFLPVSVLSNAKFAVIASLDIS